jgi:hypothetical protein
MWTICLGNCRDGDLWIQVTPLPETPRNATDDRLNVSTLDMKAFNSDSSWLRKVRLSFREFDQFAAAGVRTFHAQGSAMS